MHDRVERLKRRVKSQNIRLGLCASQGEVDSFERVRGIELPSEFRAFLLEVGNGGDGPPEHGLVGLGVAPADMNAEERVFWRTLPQIAEPFPFTRAWVWEAGNESEEGGRSDVEHGSLCLGTEGCGMYWHLIVTGPDRGRVWLLSGEGIQPTTPKRDFMRWYEDWLDGVDDWWTDPSP